MCTQHVYLCVYLSVFVCKYWSVLIVLLSLWLQSCVLWDCMASHWECWMQTALESAPLVFGLFFSLNESLFYCYVLSVVVFAILLVIYLQRGGSLKLRTFCYIGRSIESGMQRNVQSWYDYCISFNTFTVLYHASYFALCAHVSFWLTCFKLWNLFY